MNRHGLKGVVSKRRFCNWFSHRILTNSLFLFFIVIIGCIPNDTFKQVNKDGFGDSWNRYAWSMATFGDYLYVGTLNIDIWGSFDITEGLMWTQFDNSDGLIKVNSRGTEVWRYDGIEWDMVVDKGFDGTRKNIGIRNLYVHEDMLYAGTNNIVDGGEIWRSADGINWEPIMQGGFGNPTTESVRGMATYNGLLYVGVENSELGAEIHVWDGETWTKVVDGGLGNPLNISVAGLISWRGILWIFTWNIEGFEIYTYDGSNIEKVCGDGAPNPPGLGQVTNGGVLGIAVFEDRLYIGTSNFIFGADLFRTDDGLNWLQLVENGFGDYRQAYIWRMIEYQGDLYMGTFHQGSPLVPYWEGARLYRMDSEENFVELVGPNGLLMEEGFGDDQNYGIRTMAIYDEKLHLGTAQCFFCPYRTGTEIWEFNQDPLFYDIKD